MRQITKILEMALLALLVTGSAWAEKIEYYTVNEFKYTGYEWFNPVGERDTNQPDYSSTQIVAGDVFWGLTTMKSIDWINNSVAEWAPSTGDYLLGYFALEVASVVDDTISFKSLTDVNDAYGADSLFTEDDINNGVVLKWFESTVDFDWSGSSTLDNDISTLESASLWMNLSITDGVWIGQGPTDVAELGVGESSRVDTYFGLNVAPGGTISPDALAFWSDPSILGDSLAQYIGDASINSYDGNVLYNNGENLADLDKPLAEFNDPSKIRPIPEPSTMLLLGAGLLGLGAVARRRR